MARSCSSKSENDILKKKSCKLWQQRHSADMWHHILFTINNVFRHKWKPDIDVRIDKIDDTTILNEKKIQITLKPAFLS